MAAPTGTLDLEQLRGLAADGSIDTVIVAFADMQGRLVGKRTSARLFLEEIAGHGAEACAYLLAVDIDMNTVDGYAISSWQTGYGDMVLRPDLGTLRRTPWLPGTALVTADLERVPDPGEEHGGPVEVAPRRILQRQIERLTALGLEPYVGTELEFIVFDDSYREAWAKGYRGSRPPATTTSTTRCSPPPGWSRCCATSGWPWTGPGCTARASRASATSASRRSHSATRMR